MTSNTSVAASDQETVQARLEALEPSIRSICQVAGTPGISITVSYHGKHVYSSSIGLSNVEAGTPISGMTQVPIGTMAKTFTASAIAALVAEGKLDWHTPVQNIIPELHTRSSTVTKNLTVVDLLSHRAGLGRSNLWWQGANACPLLQKQDLLRFYNRMPVTGQFRGEWGYSNWGYALAGEVIERVSGTSYGQVLQEKLCVPLGMTRTTSKRMDACAEFNVASPYAALDNGLPYLLPRPSFDEDSIMGPALGGVSTAEDLLKYSMALLRSFRDEAGIQRSESPLVVREALMQLSGHIFIAKALREKSYAFGWYRTELPNTVLGMGWNSIYVKSMPKIVPRTHVGPLIAHGGSLPGYHVSVALLPGIDSSVVVCTNSIALGDVSGWISMAALEILVDSSECADYLALATEAAGNARTTVQRLQARLDAEKMPGKLPRAADEYTGTYWDEETGWFIEVKSSISTPAGLEVAFQGLDSQTWPLSHHESDVFLWLASREEQAKRGRMVTYPLVADHFKLCFQASSGVAIDRLLWRHEAGASVDQQYLSKRA